MTTRPPADGSEPDPAPLPGGDPLPLGDPPPSGDALPPVGYPPPSGDALPPAENRLPSGEVTPPSGDAQPQPAAYPAPSGDALPPLEYPPPSADALPPAAYPPPSGGYLPPAAYPPPSGGYPPPAAYPPPSGGYPPPAGYPAPGGGMPDPYAPGPQPYHPPAPGGNGRRSLLIVGSVVAAAAVVAGAFLLIGEDEPELQWQGQGIDEPEATLSDAERTVEELVDERHGALHEDGRCYFSLPEDETVKDVNEHLRCGPVLFVDGDPDEVYLTFGLSLAGDGDTTLVVEDRPAEPEPSALDPGERLSRPDGATAPDGNGGLEPPEPPRAADDVLGAMDVGPSTVGTPPEGATIGALNASYELTSLGTIERYGRGDDARRPAEGHQLIAFDVSTGPGELPTATATPTVQVQIDDEEMRDVGSIIGGTSPVVVSVPDDATSVDLVVTDAETEQRLSLLDGTPGDGNIQVLTRTNRSQTLGTAHQVNVTASDAAGSAPVTGTITVQAVILDWFLYDDPAKRPSTPQTAYLVVQLSYAWTGVEPADAGLTNQPFSVALPDGQVLPAVNLAPDPTSQAIIAIEVPADFTTGTLQIGGVDQQPTGLTVDFGGNVYSTPISIPAG